MTGGRGSDDVSRRIFALILILILLTTLIFVPVIIILMDEDDTEENEIVDEGTADERNERSIFYDREPDEVANIIGKAVRNTSFHSKELESVCGGCVWMDYYYGNDDHLNIRYSEYGENEYYYGWLYFAKSDYKDNEGIWDEDYAIDHIENVLHGLLEPFNISDSSDYRIDIVPWSNDDSTWKISVVQILDGFEVDGTGLVAQISRSNGEIRAMTVKDWIIPDYPFNVSTTIEDSKNLIYSELSALKFNLSYGADVIVQNEMTGENISARGHLFEVFNITIKDIDYAGPSLFDGYLCHQINVELVRNETLLCTYIFLVSTENGQILKWDEEAGSGGRGITFFNNINGENIKWSESMMGIVQ